MCQSHARINPGLFSKDKNENIISQMGHTKRKFFLKKFNFLFSSSSGCGAPSQTWRRLQDVDVRALLRWGRTCRQRIHPSRPPTTSRCCHPRAKLTRVGHCGPRSHFCRVWFHSSRNFGQILTPSPIVMRFITKTLVLSSQSPWPPPPLRPWSHLWTTPKAWFLIFVSVHSY